MNPRTRTTLIAGVTACSGCVLADPAPTLPLVPDEPPVILVDSAIPSSQSFSVWPKTFVVPVSLVDPSKPLLWNAYEDYSFVNTVPTSSGSILAGDGAAVRTIYIPTLPEPLGPGCHTVEVIVAYGFGGPVGATPVAPGGAIVRWTFNRSAGLGDCTAIDAGYLEDGSFPDAGGGG